MITKKNVLILSFVGALIFLSPVLFYNFFDCYNSDTVFCSRSYQSFAMFFGLFIPLLLLSLITYFMRDEVFDAWISFACLFAPIVVLMTLLLSGGSGGSMGVGDVISRWFNGIIIGVFYAVLVLVSLYKIIHTHKQIKDKAIKKQQKQEARHHHT